MKNLKPICMPSLPRWEAHLDKRMRKSTPLHLVIARLKPLPLHHQIAFLRSLVAAERPFSVRRNELQSLLTGKLTRQLRKETRGVA